MRKILEKLNREKLLDFLEEYAAKDSKFANAINVRFCEPEFEEELNKINQEIHCAFDGISDYRNHDSWGNAIFDTSHIIAEIYQRADQGHIRLAFAEAEMLYRKTLENFEYQGECEISDEAEYCLHIMSGIANKAISDEDKKYIFDHCIELSKLEDGKDYGADYENDLLKIAVRFVNSENRADVGV